MGEGDTGPNTGGMGSYSPAPVLTPQIEQQVGMRGAGRGGCRGSGQERLLGTVALNGALAEQAVPRLCPAAAGAITPALPPATHPGVFCLQPLCLCRQWTS